MGKNIYFIISAVIKIIICLGMIIVSEEIANQLLGMESELSSSYEDVISSMSLESDSSVEAIEEETELSEEAPNKTDSKTTDLNNVLLEQMPIDIHSFYVKLTILLAIIIIIINCLIIYFCKSNSVLRHKKNIIVYSVASLLLGMNVIIMLLSIADLIVILCLKPKEPEDFPEPIKKIEPIEQEEYTKKQKIESIILVIVYIICVFILPSIMTIFYDDKSKYDFIYYLIMIISNTIPFVLAIKVYCKELKNGVKAFRENFRGYKHFVLKRLFLTLALVAIANALRYFVTQDLQSVNQSKVTEMPILSLVILAVIWAPIVEEAIFRGTLKRFISNRWVYVLVTGFVFGALHAVKEESLFIVAITTLPYAIMGCSFADAYYKSNNIVTDVSMHAINNLLGTIAIFLIR